MERRFGRTAARNLFIASGEPGPTSILMTNIISKLNNVIILFTPSHDYYLELKNFFIIVSCNFANDENGIWGMPVE